MVMVIPVTTKREQYGDTCDDEESSMVMVIPVTTKREQYGDTCDDQERAVW